MVEISPIIVDKLLSTLIGYAKTAAPDVVTDPVKVVALLLSLFTIP